MALMATSSPRLRSAAFARAAIVLAIVIGLDQLTKHTIASGITEGEHRNVMFGVQLVYVRNKGVAFGFFSGGGTIVLVATLAALALLVAYLAARPDRPWLW